MSLEIWIDGSRWNVVDVATVKAGEVRGIIWKATQGNYLPDSRWKGMQLSCMENSMPFASYLWNDPLNSASSQVEFFLRTIEPYLDRQEFIAVDQEQWWANWAEWNAARRGEIPWSEVDRLPASQINDTGQEICERLITATGKKIVLYSNGYFVRDYCPEMFTWIQRYHQWWSQYPYNKTPVTTTWEGLQQYYLPTGIEPTFPTGWKIPPYFDIWQFSGDKFHLPGIDGAIDLNFVKSGFLGLEPAPIPVVSQVYVPYSMNIRIADWGRVVGSTKPGSTIPVLDKKLDQDGRTWYSIPAWIASWLVEPKSD